MDKKGIITLSGRLKLYRSTSAAALDSYCPFSSMEETCGLWCPLMKEADGFVMICNGDLVEVTYEGEN